MKVKATAKKVGPDSDCVVAVEVEVIDADGNVRERYSPRLLPLIAAGVKAALATVELPEVEKAQG